MVSALRESDLRGLRINGLKKRGRTGLFTHLDLPSSLAVHFSSVCAFVERPVAEAALFGNSEKRAGKVDAKLELCFDSRPKTVSVRRTPPWAVRTELGGRVPCTSCDFTAGINGVFVLFRQV